MTTASAPATSSSEHRGPLFHNAKHRLASLSSKNEEILDQINKLQYSHSQTISAINNQLETIPDDSGQDIVNNLKFRQRRSNSLQQQQQQQSISRTDKLSNNKDLGDVIEVENDYKMNETVTVTVDDSLSSRKSAKLAMANRTVKELKKMENNNNGGELDSKYFSAENNNSDSENGNENLEDKDFNDSSSQRRILKKNPLLTINTKTTKQSQRLITPESSDSEFDLSNAHMPLAPTLGGGRNPLRAARHSSAEHYNNNLRGRAVNSLFSMDDVIEEERGSLSDVAEQNEVNTSENISPMRGKQITSANNGRKRVQKYMEDYNNDALKVKMHRRPQSDDLYADIPDDNSSVMSTDSYLQIEELRARIQKLESERADEISERKSLRRRKNNSDSISPSALSPDSSQGGASSTTSIRRRSSAPAQHQKHLENAFDMFERAFTTDHPANDSSPPPSRSMAMVVSSALSLNQRLRSFITQMEFDQLSERGLKALLKTSDEQIRSLTECLLALAPLSPKKVSVKKMERDQLGIKGYSYYPNDSSLLQMPTPSHSTRSISPIPRMSSAPIIHESPISENDQRVSPVPPSDLSPPTLYYAPQRATPRYSHVSGPTSPTLQPEYNDPQISTSRVIERKQRRISGTAYSGGANPVSSSSPSPPPMQHPPTQYDQQSTRVYYEQISREQPRRLQRLSYSNNSSNAPQPTPPAYQRTTSRPSSIVRTDELSYPSSHHVRTSSISSTSSINRPSLGRTRISSEEYVNSPVSATRPRYEYTRRYPSDGQPPIERRPTPALDPERRYSRRIVINQMYEDGYDGSNGYGDNIPERDGRDDKVGIRRSISNGNSIYRKNMVPTQEQEVNSNAEVGNKESRSEGNQKNGEIDHENVQNVQVNGPNVENGEENDGYI